MSISIYADGNLATLSGDSKIHTAKFFLTIAAKASKALIRGDLTSFDPIVRENTCQVRGLHAIVSFLDKELLEEAARVEKRARELLNLLPSIHELTVSEKLDYCFRSFLLTHGKTFQMSRALVETSGICPGMLKDRLSKKMDTSHIKAIVALAQTKMAEATVLFIQAQAGTLSVHLEDRTIRRGKLATSCAFYNFKAVLLALKALQIPILIKEHRGQAFKLLYRSQEPGALLKKMTTAITTITPIFVIEAFSSLWRSFRKAYR